MKFALAALCIVFSFGSQAIAAQPKAQSSKALHSLETMPPILGHGQDMVNLSPLDYRCMDGAEKTVPLSRVHAKIDLVKDFQELVNEFNFKVEAHFLYLLIKGNAEAKYLNRYQDDKLSTNFRFSQEIELQQRALVDGALRYQPGDGFTQKCGHKYISVLTEGGSLDVGVRFAFQNDEVKNAFNASVKVDGSFFGLSASVEKLSVDIKKKTSIQIFYHQIGGNLAHLSEIFSGKDLVACDLENWSTCKNMLAAITDYSSHVFPADVANGGAVVLNFESRPYPHHTYQLPREILLKRRSLIAQRRKQLDFLEHIRLLEDSGIETPDVDLGEARESVRYNISDIENALVMCFDNITECTDHVETIEIPQLPPLPGPFEDDDIGVIPMLDRQCPRNSIVHLTLNDEKTNNKNRIDGNVGSFHQSGNQSHLYFCRVGGKEFRPLMGHPDGRSVNYLVLKLGQRCPNGSSEFTRFFDTEDGEPNMNTVTGPVGNNKIGNNVELSFCLFSEASSGQSESAMSQFPHLPFRYSVFAEKDFPYGRSYGEILLDGEDNQNNSTLRGPTGNPWLQFQKIITTSVDTLLRLQQVQE